MAFGKTIRSSHLILFYRRMASMAAQGFGPADSIRTLAEAGGKSRLGVLIKSVHGRIKNGEPVAKVLRESLRQLGGFPDEVFDRGSELSVVYGTIADNIEREASIRNSFKGITIYPAVVGFVLLLVLTMIAIFVVPVFGEMFASFGAALPLPTRMLVGMSGVLSFALPILLLGLVASFIVLAFKRKLRCAIADRVPVLGGANRQMAAAEFILTYSMLSRIGVSSGEALRAAADSVSNEYLADRLRGMTEQTGDLRGFVDEMERAGFFTDFIAQILRTGEHAGAFSSACAEAAPAVFDEVELSNKRILGTATPLMMAVLGVAVGYIIISLYLPIFQMVTLIG